MTMRISVVVPARDAADTLADALDSLLGQEYRDWEAVIVDDGSTDATSAIAATYAESDPRIRLIRRAGLGPSAARNAGVELTTGAALLFLDADDWLTPDHLAYSVAALQNDASLDVVVTGWTFVTPDGLTVFGTRPAGAGDRFPMHAKSCPFAIHAYLLRRETFDRVGGFDPDLRVCEDWDLWQRISRLGARFGSVPEVEAPARIRPGSASTSAENILEDGLEVLARGHAPDPSLPPHPTFPQGLPDGPLSQRSSYLLCTAVGLALASETPWQPLLERARARLGAGVDGVVAADCVLQALMVSAGRPLSEWPRLQREKGPALQAFLEALGEAVAQPELSAIGRRAAPWLIRGYVGNASPLASALRALSPWGIRVARRGDLVRAARVRLRPGARVGRMLRLFPILDRRLRPLLRMRASSGFDQLFQEAADPWNYTNPYESAKYEQTLSLLPDRPIRRALEVACAEGHFTERLAHRVRELTATDVSPTALERARLRVRATHVSFAPMDLARAPLGGPFDLIVCSEVLYYLGSRRRLRRVARRMAEALAPGGHLIMAHARVATEETSGPGFDWDHGFGTRGIAEAFSAEARLDFEVEIRTPLYRIQRFRRIEAAVALGDEPLGGPRAPRIVRRAEMGALPPEVEGQVLWDGKATRLPILAYHRVAPNGSEALAPWRVHPTTFEAQIRWLSRAGFRPLSLARWQSWIEDGVPVPRGSVVITFDDGYADFTEYAAPILRRHGFDATVYVVAEHIGKSNLWDDHLERLPLLGWDEIRSLQRDGIRFQSHTVTHPALRGLGRRDLADQLARSRQILEDGLGASVTEVSYPFGDSNFRVHRAAAQAGYRIGLTCRSRAAAYADGLLALPRIEVDGAWKLPAFSTTLREFAPTQPASKPVAATAEVSVERGPPVIPSPSPRVAAAE